MAHWISVPGNAIVSDFSRPVRIENSPYNAKVKPKAGATFPYTGIFHASLPSLQNVKEKEINHLGVEYSRTCSCATPTKYEIFYGGDRVAGKDIDMSVDIGHENLVIRWPRSRNLDSGGWGGWGVSITIKFGGDGCQCREPSIDVKSIALSHIPPS
jgi:hypothetical protein